ncbi:nitrate- and nitrite sensing domain-containing protein [Spinactinospora alkalitolerans]|uniref:nitrate- and nitrite sensing domain-containing protein n=1 Tax=Spinactinospora alkalitolerans TaxID=687207 RepID=UPI00406BA61B
MRSRLVALIVIPTAAAVLLGGLRISVNVMDTLTHERIETMATLGEDVVTLANELGKERLLSAAYIADDPNPEERSDSRQAALQEQQRSADQALNDVRNGANELGDPGGDNAAGKLDSMLTSLENLPTLREEVADTRITVLPTVTKYRQVINTLIDFNETIAGETDDTELRESVRSLTALSKARDQLSYESALMLHSLMRGSMSGGIQEAIETTRARYDNEILNFTSSATPEQRRSYDETFTGLEVSRMATMRLRVMMRVETDQPLTGVTSGDSASDYQEVANETLDRMQEVESSLASSVRGESNALKSDARNTAILDSLLVLAVILAVIVVTMLVARSMVRPLRALREGAMRIAANELPDSIARMRETSAGPGEVEVAPIGVASRDEIGEVARSFDEVHRVALRLASDEAALRSNVNAMFVNLSRRSQTLVERQLRLIDGLEQGEQDADRLGDLFQLDHLATRMRRNNENLLVLSGQDNTRKWAQPVPLVDVLRGAISEVEQYERVNVRAPSHVSVLGRPVNDVIHLVAELVENATAFSSHDTQVSVTARALEGGEVMVEVTDSGIGMAPEEVDATNARLAEPPVIDVAVSRRMGLFVVSRLAARHGIQVRLRAAHNGGITALVVLPADLLITPVESTPALGAGRSGVPDTYAEAAAAFASAPAPADPSDIWQSQSSGDRPSWQRETPSALPKRPDPADRGQNGHQEHPPSGQDLWADSGWIKPAEPPAAPQPPAAAPEEPVEPEPPRRQTEPSDGFSAFSRPAAAPRPEPSPAPQERPVEQQPWRAEEDARPEETRSWQEPPPPSRTSEPEIREGYGSTAYLSRRYGGSNSNGTVVPPSPENGSETLPIFDSIESNWFRRRPMSPAVTTPDTGPIGKVNVNGTESAHTNGSTPPPPPERPSAPPAAATPRPEDEWRSESDSGWKAAQTASEPVAGGLTSSGLPKRVPKANLVPGTAPAPENFKQITSRSADRVRNRFSGFQQGVRQGRHEAGDQTSKEN